MEFCSLEFTDIRLELLGYWTPHNIKYVLNEDETPPKMDLFGGNGGGINIESFLIDVSVIEFVLTNFCILLINHL